MHVHVAMSSQRSKRCCCSHVVVGLCQCPSLIAQKGRQCSAGSELGRQLLVGAPLLLPVAGPGACLESRALVVYTSGRL